MALAAQLAAWAFSAGWALASDQGYSGELGGARVTVRVAPIDDDTAELALSSDENCLRLSVSLTTSPPFCFALSDELSRLAEATNELLERATVPCAAGEDLAPLGVALSALCAAAARAPAHASALRSSDAAMDGGGDDQDSDSDEPGSPSEGWYSGDMASKVRRSPRHPRGPT